MPEPSLKHAYENLVELKYQLYNSLFLTLPLDAVEQTGLLLPLLEEASFKGLEDGLNPTEILEQFFTAHRPGLDEHKQAQFLFKIIQYVERQIVLLDALEDAAFKEIHQTDATNRLRKLIERVDADGLEKEFKTVLSKFVARVILTAHPTQFYPGPVLAIINDLTEAIKANDIGLSRDLLQQLGNTPFFQKEKPTPLNEAAQLTWYLSNIFYPSFGEIQDNLSTFLESDGGDIVHPLSIGFWPGGDRDGNPYVTTAITLQVAENLRYRILECYHQDIRSLKRRLSFDGIYEKLESIEKRIHAEMIQDTAACFATVEQLAAALDTIQQLLVEKYQGLFLDQLQSFRRKVAAFGFHFASLDIRQDSRVLNSVLSKIRESSDILLPPNFDELGESAQIEALLAVSECIEPESIEDELCRDTLESLQAIKTIQARNGMAACHRYIISNCRGPIDIARLIALFQLAGTSLDDLNVDIVPLFETINDLRHAGENMRSLYQMTPYRRHLQRRDNRQTVMLGFSDGTKDGGYLMANWAIYSAKENVTEVSRLHEIEVAFFDGRGGPPARGGGSTYKFYAALGKKIESNQIQLTVQGQTISSYYGTADAALHNLRQLLAAGLENNLYDHPERELNDQQRSLMEDLAELSFQKYLAFKEHPLFLAYLEQMSTLKYYAQTNIGSRPTRRGAGQELQFEDLRAIPFVGAWSQLKQNVPGYYGLGTALKSIEREGRLEECQQLYQHSGFFEALIGNSMQSMSKSDFRLTAYMQEHPVFGKFWQSIYDEYQLSLEMVLKVSGQTVMLEDNPTSRNSIGLRQRVVLPLLIVQQFALMKLNTLAKQPAQETAEIKLYEKMVIRSLFGNINAARNSA
ncbi:MAG: phosphoenolpyruvate carboxylase [Proteobacteria bacterium]|nr:phosphoenolpyruvate carboxylase [Pseudomonadota bacterium]